MKKIYVSIIGLLAVGSSYAQVSNVAPMSKKSSQMIGQVKPSKVAPAEKAVILWEDDFSTPANWTIVNDGTNTEVWSIVTGDYSASIQSQTPFTSILSTSAANGYLFVDSDANNSADNDGTEIITTATNATPINLTGEPNVKLTYQHNFRWWKDTRGVRVSGDNGVTWTEYEMSNVTDYSTPNQNSDNPHITVIDISAVAGGQSQVLVQFYYGDNDIWGWYWAVDDVKITVTDDYDLTLNGAYWGSTGFWGARLPYYQIPAAQATAIDFSGIVQNNGVMTQSDITFSAIIPSFYTGASAQYSLTAAQYDTLDCITAFTPTATPAAYTASFATTSGAIDAFMSDNTIPSVTFNVNNYIYARDAGTIVSGTFNSGDGFEAGNVFDIFANTTASAIDVVIGATAVVGTEMYVKLYSIDPATGDFIYLDESLPHILVAGDLGQKLTLALQNAQPLTAGEGYVAVAGSFGDGGQTNDLVVATSGVSDIQTSFYFDMTDTQGSPTGTWFYTTSTPMVRLNFSPASINEVENNFGLNVYPNPANTSATVSMELSNDADVTINVSDLAGKVVYTNALGTVNGTQNVTINTDALTSGVYMVNVSVDGIVSTQKLVVRK